MTRILWITLTISLIATTLLAFQGWRLAALDLLPLAIPFC